MFDGSIYCATWIECKICGAKTKEVWNTHYDDRPNDREKEVIDKWNRRKPMDDIMERLKDRSKNCIPLADEFVGGKFVGLRQAIDIVKTGGAYETNKETHQST